MMLELVKAAALLLALSLLHGMTVRFAPPGRWLGDGLSGLLFGGICVVGMLLPIELLPGIIFDPRSVILSMAGLFGGPLVGLVAGSIAGGYRAWLGGGGAAVGVAVVVVSVVLGLAYRYAHHRHSVPINLPALLVFGLVVHVVEVGLFTQLPDAAVAKVMDTVALPLILTFTPATAFLGLLLLDVDRRLRTEANLRASEARLSLHLENTPLAAIAWDLDLRVTHWNRAAERIFGFSRDEALGRDAFELIIPDWAETGIQQVFASLISRRGGERNTNENVTKDGRVIICDWYNTPVTDDEGNTVGVMSLAEDVTEQRRAQSELRLKNMLLTTEQEASLDGILAVDAAGRVISMNRRFVSLWGISDMVAQSKSEQALLDAMLAKVAEPELYAMRVRYLYDHQNERADDEIQLLDGRVLERHSAPMHGPDSTYHGRVWMFRDVTARKRSEELIWNQANFDGLTGLANRQMLRDRLEQDIKKAHRSGERVALLYLDLDRFKDVNDTLGHDVGDDLLVDAARRLAASVRDVDTVARLGGDEFVVIVGALEEAASVERIAGGILEQLVQPFPLKDELAYVSASIGITFYPDDGADAEQLLRNADQAMYAAKGRGGNCYQYFTVSMQRAAVARMSMAKDLRVARPDEEFVLYYQPIVDLNGGVIRKAEALIRWRHPKRGLVMPGDFIPVAEESRLIVDIGDWVFRTAARQVLDWRERFDRGFQVGLNTSPVQYRSENFDVTTWMDHLRQIGLPGQAIVVEITEGLLLDTGAKVAEELLVFRDAGVQVSLDDFGTGYSSLSYLNKLDIDFLKIDQSFVRGLESGSDDLALCEAIIVMAHKLGLKVVAEGIETAEQRELLHAAGCDYGQGYLFARPCPVEEFERLLKTGVPTA